MRSLLVAALGLGISVLAVGTASAQVAAATGDTTSVTTDARVPAGDHVISTRFYRPAGKDRYPIVVLCFGAGNESMLASADARSLATAFAARGVATLAYDKRGT